MKKPIPRILLAALAGALLASLLLAGCGSTGGATQVKGQWDTGVGVRGAR